ncbi:hypothetical protein [Flavivirga jejuensis]|uniref:Uncharacterized protein n=1 Tax=Flavivirga jejuensis TaxID=870487 RepID=A0ABT8WT97_9FLAO|nr:hypothetical protein [Flavivirga jejuensis]MDO5976399.1 hypothetical protein [Flavivirga jejuensis]
MNIEEIKTNYQNFDDSVIIKIAKNESESLVSEVKQILKDEILKRNLSSDLIDIIEQKQEYNTRGKFEKIIVDNKIYFANNFFRFISILSISIICFLFIVKPLIGGGGGIKMVFGVIILFFIIRIFIPNKIGKIILVKSNSIIFSLSPSPNFGFFRIIVLIRVIFSQLSKVEINYTQIIKIYRKTELLNNGYCVEYKNQETNQISEKRIYLDVIDKKDLAELIDFLKYKNINVEL